MNENVYHSRIRYDVIPLVPSVDRIIDVGGGTGETVKYLKEIGKAKKIGVIDIVDNSDNGDFDYSLKSDLNDIDKLRNFSAENGPFNAILMLDILEHTVDPWNIVDYFTSCLPSGGRIIASIPNVRHMSVVFPLLFSNSWDYAESGLLDRTHLRFFVKKTAVGLFKHDALTIEKVTASPIGSRRHKILNFLTLGIFRSFFTLQYFVVAKKI